MILIRHFLYYKRDDWHENDRKILRIDKPFPHMFVLVLDIPDELDFRELAKGYNQSADEFIQWMTDNFGPFNKKNPTWWVHKERMGFLRVFTNDPKIVMLINLTWKGTNVV